MIYFENLFTFQNTLNHYPMFKEVNKLFKKRTIEYKPLDASTVHRRNNSQHLAALQ